MNLAKNCILIGLILLFLVLGIHQQLRLNELEKTSKELEERLTDIQHENEKKQNELDTPLEDQIEKYANDLGYRDPNAQYYYNDFSG